VGSPLLQETIGEAGRRIARGAWPTRSSRRSHRLHVHWFRWVGSDAFSSASLYACRCGEVRPGL
jgi:hypothetical protein